MFVCVVPQTNKPLMEKRRRARINDSLTQLKSLVIQGSKKDVSVLSFWAPGVFVFSKILSPRSNFIPISILLLLLSFCSFYFLYRGFSSLFLFLLSLFSASHIYLSVCSLSVCSLPVCLLSLSVCYLCVCLLSKCLSISLFALFLSVCMLCLSVYLLSVCLVCSLSFCSLSVLWLSVGCLSAFVLFTLLSFPIAPATPIYHWPRHQTHVPVVITSNLSSTAASTESSRVKFTQPLHIQIPPVLSPVIIQSKLAPHQKPLQPQAIHKIQDTLPHIRCTAPQETIVSSSTISPEAPTLSPTMPTNQPYVYYTPEDHYVDVMPRSRTYSLTSSASSDSDLTSPLNLSQSPHYYDQKDTNNYSSPLSSHISQASIAAKTSSSHNVPRHSSYSTQFASVIVDGRKTIDSQALKYLHLMDEDRMWFRHDGTSSPASSVGEERLWRPW